MVNPEPAPAKSAPSTTTQPDPADPLHSRHPEDSPATTASGGTPAPAPDPAPAPTPVPPPPAAESSAAEPPEDWRSTAEYKAELARATKAAREQAKKEAKEQAEEEARRAKMEETERLKEEKADAEKARLEAESKAAATAARLALYETIAELGVQLVDKDAAEFVQLKAAKKVESDGLGLGDAIKAVLAEKPFLIKQQAAAPAPTPATTVPTPAAPDPGSPSEPAPEEEKDAFKMSKAEFRDYMREKVGISI